MAPVQYAIEYHCGHGAARLYVTHPHAAMLCPECVGAYDWDHQRVVDESEPKNPTAANWERRRSEEIK